MSHSEVVTPPRTTVATAKALVVDDDSAVRGLIARQLRRLGVPSVETATDGADAMRVMEASDARFDVAVCDLRMPNEDGLVLLRRMAALSQPPAIILTSGEDPLFLDAARRLGIGHRLTILGILSKPHTTAALAELLAAIDAPPVAARTESRQEAPLQGAELEHMLEAGLVEAWFQPQIELATRRVVGAEALLRLRHPRRGLMLPGSFMCQAEKQGLLPALTEFVLRRAVASRSTWRDEGFELSVSINVSAATMHDLTYPDFAAALCTRHGVCPTEVVFELTESALASDATALLDILTRLRLKGFGVSIDDFGTGHSSLDLLRTLPFSELKLDHTLVQDAARNSRSRLILQNSLALAAQLGISTVAEGVDSPCALDLVSDLGCTLAQGFLIAEPMPADAIAGWLAVHQPRPPGDRLAGWQTPVHRLGIGR
jgi:EAL domain-containing protein (putative c-di-GMP-specific phosphodiesterase class I)